MTCHVGLALNNQQQVVSVTDRVLGSQVWYNVERSRKPQTFMQVCQRAPKSAQPLCLLSLPVR